MGYKEKIKGIKGRRDLKRKGEKQRERKEGKFIDSEATFLPYLPNIPTLFYAHSFPYPLHLTIFNV
jgi:hypothetical protein